MNQLKILFVLFLFSFYFIYGQNNNPSTKLSEVLITATKTPTSAIEVASSYTLINSEYLKKYQNSSALEVLRTIEGISISQQGGPGKLGSIFTRGANSNHTLVLIDGVEMNDPSSTNNAYDLANLMIYNIDRIEIVRGPQSTLYGSEAMAGVINIITNRGSGKPGVNFSGVGGSNGFYKGSISAGGSSGILRYSAGIAKLKTNGISAISKKYGSTENDGHENTSASARLGLDIMDNINLDLLYRFTYAESGLDQSGKSGDDPNYNYDVEEHVFGFSTLASFFDDKWNLKLTSGVTRKISHAIDKPDEIHPAVSSSNFSNATRLKFGWQNIFTFIKSNKITVGIETEEEKAATSFRSESVWGPYESKFPQKSVRTNSVYIQDQIAVFENLFASVGLRYDDHEKFGGHTTYRIAPAYYFASTGTKFRATYGTGFKAPSLFYLFDPAFGNPDLNPEVSTGWDIGIDQYMADNKLSLGITYFRTDYNELIGFDANFVTVNIDKAETEGVELFAEYNNRNNLVSKLNYTFTSAKDKSADVTEEFEDLIRRPDHKINLNLNYSPIEKLNLNLNINYTGERKDDDFESFPTQRVTLKSYTTVNIGASYKLFEILSVIARIDNLFDEQYEEVLYYGTLGRAFYAGVGIEL